MYSDDKNLNNENSNSQDVNESESKSQESNSEAQHWKNQFVRLNADFDNYKKRIIKEKTNWTIACQADILSDILNIVDDFDRALQESKKSGNKELEVWISGFEMIYKSLQKLLEKYEVKEITDFSSFDPEYHEAIAQVDSPDYQSGQIVSVAQKGYILQDRVLRPAKVTVAK